MAYMDDNWYFAYYRGNIYAFFLYDFNRNKQPFCWNHCIFRPCKSDIHSIVRICYIDGVIAYLPSSNLLKVSVQ